MIRNLFKISLRNLIKGKFYTLLNILGLSLGITSSLFLVFYVLDELNFDAFHEKGHDLYRVVTHITEVDNQFTWAVAQIPFGPAAKRDFPEVDKYVRVTDAGRMLFRKGGENFYEENLNYADTALFELFSYPLIQGDPVTCLNEPNVIVINEDLAKKYFGRTDVVGEMMEGENQQYKVTGVMKNLPKNTLLRDADGFISFHTLQGPRLEGHWGNFGVYTFLYTPGLTDAKVFQEKVQQIYTKYCEEIFKPFGVSFTYELQNIGDIHLYSKAAGEAETNGDIAYVYIFSAVAFFILLIAGINYMNLSTARSIRRAREVGIRKIVGSGKTQLIAQFLTESVLLTLLSLVLSLLLVVLLLPSFNNLLDKGIGLTVLVNPAILLSLVGIVIFLGILSGTYPAFFLSSYQPVMVLKSNSSGSTRSGSPLLRKFLVVLQFGISVTMITSTWMVYDQLSYLRKKDLGFNKDHVIRLQIFNREMGAKIPALKDELRKQTGVVSVGSASTSPGYGIGKNLIYVENDKGELVDRGIDLYAVDYDYIPALGMEMVEGRNFSRDFPSDTTSAVLVTEAMAGRMNWDNAIGKKFRLGTEDTDPIANVVGVVKDYHHRSLYDVIEPVLFLLRENNPVIHIRINPADIKGALSQIETAWNNVFPGLPFEYNFLDQEFDGQYKNDERRGQVFSVFSIITIVIACLGLLGLASYTSEQRTREIGIRKVVGASAGRIVMMISKDFLVLVLIAIILAIPVAWYFMDGWLETFAYRVDMKIITFVFSSFAALIITFLTISYHTLKAANINPAISLREE